MNYKQANQINMGENNFFLNRIDLKKVDIGFWKIDYSYEKLINCYS